jgi:hypothetical protein
MDDVSSLSSLSYPGDEEDVDDDCDENYNEDLNNNVNYYSDLSGYY